MPSFIFFEADFVAVAHSLAHTLNFQGFTLCTELAFAYKDSLILSVLECEFQMLGFSDFNNDVSVLESIIL